MKRIGLAVVLVAGPALTACRPIGISYAVNGGLFVASGIAGALSDKGFHLESRILKA